MHPALSTSPPPRAPGCLSSHSLPCWSRHGLHSAGKGFTLPPFKHLHLRLFPKRPSDPSEHRTRSEAGTGGVWESARAGGAHQRVWAQACQGEQGLAFTRRDNCPDWFASCSPSPQGLRAPQAPANTPSWERTKGQISGLQLPAWAQSPNSARKGCPLAPMKDTSRFDF